MHKILPYVIEEKEVSLHNSNLLKIIQINPLDQHNLFYRVREIFLQKSVIPVLKNKMVYIFNLIMSKFHPIINVIGDSHCLTFEGQKYFIPHFIGSVTAFKLRYLNNSSISKERLFQKVRGLNRRSIILMILGEIDCRIHIYKQYKLHEGRVPISDLIQRTVDNYCYALSELKLINKKVTVLSIPPAGYLKNIYNVPFYGSQKIRGQIHREFNNLLEIACKKYGIKFVNLYKYVVDENGLVKRNYLVDTIHLNKKVMQYVFDELGQKSSK